jgi:hypothetical protein
LHGGAGGRGVGEAYAAIKQRCNLLTSLRTVESNVELMRRVADGHREGSGFEGRSLVGLRD